MKKISRTDVCKARTSGSRAQKSNSSGNKRGMGLRNSTVQKPRKFAKEWNVEHGMTFVDERNQYDPTIIAHFDATNFKAKVCHTDKVKGPQGTAPLLKTHEAEKRGATGYVMSRGGNVNYDPGFCEALEINYPKCCDLKNAKRGVDDWPCTHGPAVGEDRTCGGGGTRFQHVIHLEHFLETFCESTGIQKRKLGENPSDNDPLRILQLDKSTNLIYLRAKNDLGYNGIPTKRLLALITRVEAKYKVKIHVLVQPTHYFLFNANDALLFSILKQNARKIAAKRGRFPTNLEKLRSLWDDATDAISQHACHSSIKRAHSYDAWGNKNMGEPPYPKSLDSWDDLNKDQFDSDFDDVDFHYSDSDESDSDSQSDDSHGFWDE